MLYELYTTPCKPLLDVLIWRPCLSLTAVEVCPIPAYQGGQPASSCSSLLPSGAVLQGAGCISLDVLEAPVVRSGHGSLQMHSNSSRTASGWSFQTAAAEREVSTFKFIATVYRKEGCPTRSLRRYGSRYGRLLDRPTTGTGHLARLWLPASSQHRQQGREFSTASSVMSPSPAISRRRVMRRLGVCAPAVASQVAINDSAPHLGAGHTPVYF